MAYNRVLREVLRECLKKKRVSTVYIRVIKDMYKRIRTRVKTLEGDTKDFPIKIGLH